MTELLPKTRADVVRDTIGAVVAGLASVAILWVTGVWTIWRAFGRWQGVLF
jgi:hypothetical protein